MAAFLTMLMVPPALITYGLLRCTTIRMAKCAVIAALSNAALWVFLYTVANQGIHMTGESERFVDHLVFYSLFAALIVAGSLIPVGLVCLGHSRLKASKNERTN
jgi:hypothetical protein